MSINIPKGVILWFTPSFTKLLGFPRYRNTTPWNANEATLVEGETPLHIEVIYSLYVYTDVAENVAVGDTSAPLLRIVDASGAYDKMITRSYDKPRYIPVQKKYFDNILIDIRSDTGDSIPFENGACITTLHFRQAKGAYFV